MTRAERRSGYAEGIASYVIWGVLPIYWKLLSGTSSLEVLAYRMWWSFVFMFIICVLVKRTRFLYLARDRRSRRIFLISGVMITINWGIYIFAIATGNIVEASLGYFMNPVVNIVLGVVFFHEKLTRVQLGATAASIAGVIVLTLDYGRFPWIAVVLAVTFGLYAAIKKRGGYAAMPGMAIESLFTGALGLLLIAIGVAWPGLWQLIPVTMPDAHAVTDGWGLYALLIFGGVVTAYPLWLFSSATNKMPLSILGFFQYLSPTISLLIGVFLYGEAFTTTHLACFALIWAGIIAMTVEAVRPRRARTGD